MAKKDGWKRDLQSKIQAKADALVSKRDVSNGRIHGEGERAGQEAARRGDQR
ncbi:hypothetical protein [Roseateles sp.]|uniref:hypothetical protein n=1 Tax=Roseateles sp. TaxID=1971397 RepID=UPI0031DB74FC